MNPLFNAFDKIIIKLLIRSAFVKVFQTLFLSMISHFVDEWGEFLHAEYLRDITGVQHAIDVFKDKVFGNLIVAYQED